MILHAALRPLLITWLLLLSAAPIAAAKTEDPTTLVDPMVGTAPSAPDFGFGGGGGNTFPGAGFPFGMIQWTPVTVPEGLGGYDHRSRRLLGFPLTALSGGGCQAFGELPFIPARRPPTDSPETSLASLASPFSHRREVARPGHYRVRLPAVEVDLAAGERAATGRFRFASPTGTLLWRSHSYRDAALSASLEATSDRELRGSVSAGRLCGVPGNAYRVNVVARFDRPFSTVGSWQESELRPGGTRADGPHSGLWVTFDTRRRRAVRLEVALSFVDLDGAARNLSGDHVDFDLRKRIRQAQRAWRRLLSRVRVEGGTRTRRRVFYTALYHSLIQPNLISDDDGRYPGPDGTPRHASHPTYGNFAGWDFYRAQAALLAIVAPGVASDLAQSLVDAGTTQAGMPRWSLAGQETGLMVGDPSTPAIATMYAFGARSFDVAQAMRLAVRSGTDPSLADEYKIARPGLASYIERGFIAPDDTVWGEVSTTLEYATADFALARLAAALGEDEVHDQFVARSENWRGVFNPTRRIVQPRLADGSFLEPFHAARDDGAFQPTPPDDGLVEGNALQYTWAVPQDVRGVVAAVGGRRSAVSRLHALLRKLNAGPNRPYAFVSNESNLLLPWVPNWTKPSLAQRTVRRMALQLFRPGPAGLPGNDDLGALSSAAVFAHLGIYPAVPGVGGLTLTSPLFPQARLRSSAGKTIVLEAPKGHRLGYVRAVRLGNRRVDVPWVRWAALRNEKRLAWSLSSRPQQWSRKAIGRMP